jgi:Fe-S-cluster formation regulator IscX/YfhJ
MSEERKKILEILAAGKITVDEAEKLLAALSAPETGAGEGGAAKPRCRYLKIQVEPDPSGEKQERVNIRVPLKLIRAGLKWAAFIPKEAQSKVNEALSEKGIDMDLKKITPQDLEDLISQLDDFTVDVEGKEKIKICCE